MIGEAIERAFVNALIGVFFIGGAFFVGAYFLIHWIVVHLSIHWK